jgi:secretin/TonB-like protein
MRYATFAASWKSGLIALVGLAALILPVSPVRDKAPAEPAQAAACPKSGTYTADVDGAPDKGVCRESIDQATPASFNIPPGKLFDALKAYLEQSDARGLVPLDIMVAKICTSGSDCVRGPIPTAGVSGNLPPREALEQLLKGTGVTFVQDQSGTFHFPPLKEAAVPGGRCVWDKSPWKGCPSQPNLQRGG